MRAPSIDPEVASVVPTHDDHWIVTWEIEPPDDEWLLAFWQSMVTKREMAVKATCEDEARAAFARMVEQATANWRRVTIESNDP